MATSLTLSTIRRRFSSASRSACSTFLRWAISRSSSRRRSSLARATMRDSASSRSVRTWSSTRATIGSRWLRKFGVLGTKSRTPARRASTSRSSSCMPVTRIAGTLCPAALTWRNSSRPLVPWLRFWSRTIRSIPPPATRLSPSSAVAAVATSYPARSRRSRSSRATPGSSSTSRIVARLSLVIGHLVNGHRSAAADIRAGWETTGRSGPSEEGEWGGSPAEDRGQRTRD